MSIVAEWEFGVDYLTVPAIGEKAKMSAIE